MAKIDFMNDYLSQTLNFLNNLDTIEVSSLDIFKGAVDALKPNTNNDKVDDELIEEIESLKQKFAKSLKTVEQYGDAYNKAVTNLIITISQSREIGAKLLSYDKFDRGIFVDARDPQEDSIGDILYRDWDKIVDINKIVSKMESEGFFDEIAKEAVDNVSDDMSLIEYCNNDTVTEHIKYKGGLKQYLNLDPYYNMPDDDKDELNEAISEAEDDIMAEILGSRQLQSAIEKALNRVV